MQKQKFMALSRLCLNNWHYIDKKVLSFSDEINFFTGHSGSGKSTVIDALQILLYANSDGRGFFNKAAADDSDRSLIEYLRGMVNIGEDNEFSYLRNKNFSTTIVMELKQTDTGECQSIGVAFDVQTAANEVVSRLFFWHKGPLLIHHYRMRERAMSADEIKEELRSKFSKEEYYLGPSNERFRKQLYDIYLGGLNSERFPKLFKRAIPFRMNIKLEEFVKEYICMEDDIHIEDMQESVMQYGRMRKRIGDTLEEIGHLKEIGGAYRKVKEKDAECRKYQYFMNGMEVRFLREQDRELRLKAEAYEGDRHRQEQEIAQLDKELFILDEQNKELIRQIHATGYDEVKQQLAGVNELLERLTASKAKWDRTALELGAWAEVESASNAMLWDIERFAKYSISEQELGRLKASLLELREEIQEQKRDAEKEIRELKKEEKVLTEELRQLKQGKKAYPKELEEARYYIQKGLKERFGKIVPVEILADLLELRDDTWRNAVEGYLGGNKLLLIVEPKYAKDAMELYEELDRNQYFRVAVLDTEKVMEETHAVMKGALSEEVMTQHTHVRAYIDFQLGGVKKCEGLEELRSCKVGITRECILYHSYKLQYINPDHYTRRAYIGEISMRRRICQLEEKYGLLQEQLKPLEKLRNECRKVLELESLNYPLEEYVGWEKDIRDRSIKETEKHKLVKKLEALRQSNVEQLEEKQRLTEEEYRKKQSLRDSLLISITTTKGKTEEVRQENLRQNELLVQREREYEKEEELEKALLEYLKMKKDPNYDSLRAHFLGRLNRAKEEGEALRSDLRAIRADYLRRYQNRTFSPEDQDNQAYDKLLNHLQYGDLEEMHRKAKEQAEDAVRLFKQDFVYKIRSSIKDALQRKDELNKIISKLDFGKDKYRFVIGKNKGPDGRYYDMFMDENLEVNPRQLSDNMESQMDLFTMNHQSAYDDLINELIAIFIPPDHASVQELEEAKRNMDRYADYRTYLSFDMQQIIDGEVQIKIQLSKMLKKNSGGEGQNPLYVALLASFAQAYRINLAPKMQRHPTIRLVILDEAFSKMDAEKVASCIELIRGLGFQAIISATNDKIQNYLENVNKTFVFANPNKKKISIQEFERTEFAQLTEETEERRIYNGR